ncbi:hypothetical protein [Sulfurovum mangrovi]|uniref:hypothetical protein n=1 Tax=Sulfurovum mangrovi TaxID=2893889 RepID=UPI001E5D19F4|nr:hypothetical protein [Sulfurovum mangrovi]UFH59334.1 hypothetical protein LN246_00435 [Sulfurovum mangrovi]
MMEQREPSLESLEDYRGEEKSEKRLTIWLVILSGLLVGALYSIVKLTDVSSAEAANTQEVTGILKY